MHTSFIQSKLDYCCVVWEGLSAELSDKLQKLQNRAVRIITNSPYDASSGPLLEQLGLYRLKVRRGKLLAIEMYKIYNGQVPIYLRKKFTKPLTPYGLRDSSSKLQLPLPKTNYGKKRLSYKGAYVWNNLPKDLRDSKSLNTFKQRLNKLPLCFFDLL